MKAGIHDLFLKLQAASSKSAKSKWDESKTKHQDQPSPRQVRESPLSQTSAARPRAVTLPPRERQPTLGKDECRTSKPATAPPSQQNASSKTYSSVRYCAYTVYFHCPCSYSCSVKQASDVILKVKFYFICISMMKM